MYAIYTTQHVPTVMYYLKTYVTITMEECHDQYIYVSDSAHKMNQCMRLCITAKKLAHVYISCGVRSCLFVLTLQRSELTLRVL